MNPLAKTFESKEYYRKSFYLALKIIFAALLIIFFLIGIIVYQACSEKEPRIVAVTNDWRVTELPPLNIQHITDPKISQWATDTLPEIISFDFDRLREQLLNSKNYFSPKAWTNYYKLLKKQAWLTQIKEKRLLTRCIVTAPPMITKRFYLNGKLTMEIQAPVTVTLQSTQKVHNRYEWKVKMLIQRCSLTESPTGFRIVLLQII